MDCNVAPYSYDRTSFDDDFGQIAESMVAATAIVFATPVYWYAMSGLTKTVLDRFTDLTSFRKDLG
jgi:multimeric flavodoxin WrbA